MAIFRKVRTEVYCDICGMPVIGWESGGAGVSRKMAAYYARKEGCTTGKKIICKSCRINRRIEKCSPKKDLIKGYGDGSYVCLGTGKPFDNEPVEHCKRCIACASYDWEKNQ